MFLRDLLSITLDFQISEVYLYVNDLVVGGSSSCIWRSCDYKLHDLAPFYSYIVRCIGASGGSRFYIIIEKG